MPKVTLAARTDRGVARKTNQDVALVGEWASGADAAALSRHDIHLAGALACAAIDGMGGHAAGEVAAWLTAQSLARGLATSLDAASADALAQRAHALVSDAGRGIGAPDMGAAFAAIVLRPSGYAVVNVGDCRVYRFAEHYLGLLTVDDAALSRGDPTRTVLTQSIGGGAPIRLDAHWYEAVWRPGTTERFLLASDGLAVVDEADVARHLGAASPDDAASTLMDAALDAGAPDNVTVVVVDVATEAEDSA